ncbi:MAG: hypothetical protein AB197_00710 [Parcubacteria bacterium C7867-002]|nr:MAG: hypothetical protein AB197_00710 [Parcubacteria bacterium C7867-002]
MHQSTRNQEKNKGCRREESFPTGTVEASRGTHPRKLGLRSTCSALKDCVLYPIASLLDKTGTFSIPPRTALKCRARFGDNLNTVSAGGIEPPTLGL